LHCRPCHYAAALSKCALINLRSNVLLILFGVSWEARNDSMGLETWIILRPMVSTGSELRVFRCLLSNDLSLLTINPWFTFDQLFVRNASVQRCRDSKELLPLRKGICMNRSVGWLRLIPTSHTSQTSARCLNFW